MMHLGTLSVPAIAQTTNSTATAPPACAPATAEVYLDIGNVRAKILNNGALFRTHTPGTTIRNGAPGVYEVPKGGGVHSMFSASLWLGGMVDDELRVAASLYTDREFWPGPVASDAPPADGCAAYDRIWEVGTDDLQKGRGADTNVSTWPVHVGAPFTDVDGDGAYRPDRGDRPELLGDQQLWWIMNDASGPHVASNSDALAVEVRATAFAFDAPGAVGNSTFYRYRIRNTSTHPILDTYTGVFVDTDLGFPYDDYVGSDTTLGMGYSYNADNRDDNSDGPGYGMSPPAIGFTVLKRPTPTINDSAACTYPDSRDSGFTSVMNYSSLNPIAPGPPSPYKFYYDLQSRWIDDKPVTEGGEGRGFSTVPTRFMYPGDPVTGSFWSELNIDGTGRSHAPSDRRFINGLGPFCMAPGEEVELVIAIVWSRGSSNLDSVRQLREDVAYIQSIRDAILTPRALSAGGGYGPGPQSGPEAPFAASVYPNPVGGAGGGVGSGQGFATVRFSTPEALEVGVTVFNVLGQRVFVAAEPGVVAAGDHSWTLPTSGWAPGVYLVRITAGHAVTTRRLVVSSTH